MSACPLCESPIAEGAQECPECATQSRFSFDGAKGTQGQAERAAGAAREEVTSLHASGIATALSERLLSRADVESQQSRFPQAYQYAQAAKRAAGIARTRSRLQGDLDRRGEEIRLAKGGGADTAAAEAALQEAATALREGRLEALSTWLKKASVRAAEEAKVKSAESVVDAAEKAIRYAKERGADIGPAEELLAKAKEALRAKAFDAAREASAAARDAAERSRKFVRYEKFVVGAERAVESGRKSGADLSEARDLITQARYGLKDGLFAEAQAKAAAAKDAVAEAKRYRAQEVLLERAERAARKEEKRGVDVSGPGLILGEGRNALEAREYGKVRQFARDAREAIKDAIISRQIGSTLDNLATDIRDLKTIGADPTEATALLEQATAALEEQDFDKSRRLASRSRRAADDAREARHQEIMVDTVQKIVAAAAISGHVDAEQVRTLIQDLDAMLAGGEAVNVEEMVKTRIAVIDPQKLRESGEKLDALRAMLLDLKRANIDIAGADESVALASRALDEGKWEESEKYLSELEEIARTLINTLRDSAVETMRQAELATEKATKTEIPIPDALRMLESAKSAMDAGKVYEALEFGRIAQARAEMAWKRHFEEEARRDVELMKATAERVMRARERIDALMAKIEYLMGHGLDVQPARDFVADAEKALQEKRVDEVEAHIDAAERIVEGMRGALRKSAEDALERLRKEVVEAREEHLMTPEMEAVLVRAEQAVRENQVREAHEIMNALAETLGHAREGRAAEIHRKEMERGKKASDRLMRVKRMVDELKEANIDIAGSEETLIEAEKAVNRLDFEGVEGLLSDLEETARDMRAELVAATRFLLAKAKESVEDGERRGWEIEGARRLLESAEEFFTKGKLDDAVESANTAKAKVDAAARLQSEEAAREEKLRLETARHKIERLRLIVDDLHRADITVEGAEDALTMAEASLSEKKYDDVHSVLTPIEPLAASLAEGMKHAAVQLIDRSRANLEAARGEGLAVRRGDMVLENAGEALRTGRFVEAIVYHKVIDDIVEDARRVRSFRELEEEVHGLRTDLASFAALGGDMKATQDLLDKAQEEVSLGRYDRVAEYAQQVRKGLTITRAHLIDGRLDRAKVAIGKAQILGADAGEAERLYREAEKHADAGNWEALDGAVLQVEDSAAKAIDSFMDKKADEDFLAVEDLAKRVAESGLDVPEAARFMEEAHRLRKEQNFTSMTQMLGEARRVLEDSSHDHVVAEHRKKMSGLAALLVTAKQIGANVAEAERVLQQAETAIQSNDMGLAGILVKQAEVSTGLQIQSFIQNKYPNLVVRMPTSGLQANAWNRLVVELTNKGSLGAKNVDLKFEGDVEVRGVKPIEELAVNETKTIEVGVKPKKDGEVPINVRLFYERYFDTNRYEVADHRDLKVESPGTYLVEDVFLIHTDGRLIAHESRKFRQEIDEDIFSGMLTVVQDFIKDSFRQRAQTGLKRLDFGQSKILIERSPHSFLAAVILGSEPALLPLYMAEVLREIENKYGDTLSGWSGMLQELPGIAEVVGKLILVTQNRKAERGELGVSEVAEMESLLGLARQAGAETAEVEELLAQAENSLESDMDLAWNLLTTARTRAKESQQRLVERMRLRLEQTAEAVEHLKELGANAAPSEILLKEARAAFEMGRYDKVEEIAENVRATLERIQQDSMARQIESQLSNLIQEIEKARAAGADVTRAEAYLVKIEDALTRRNFRAVDDHMRRARDAVREDSDRAIMERSGSELERLTQMIVESKSFGAEAAEAEALLLRAREALAEGRADDLDAIVKQAGTVARQRVHEFLEDKYPRLFLSLPTSGLQADAWNRFVVEFVNKGNLAAKDVELEIAGAVEVEGLKPITRIDPNERKRLEIGLRPKGTGTLPVDVGVRYARPLDDRRYELTDSKHLRAEQAGTYRVEDVFLIHKDGRLIHHESRRYRHEVDEDIFSGMLTIILNHVKESFAGAEKGLRRLDFGEKSKILVERSPSVYLAAAVVGGEPVVLPIYMVDCLKEIEDRFGERLAGWNGYVSELEGIEDLIRRILFVTESAEAELGPLTGSPLEETMRLIAEGASQHVNEDFVQEARAVIETKAFENASEFVQKAVQSFQSGREELTTQLREAVVSHGEVTGLRLTDEQMKVYIEVVRRAVEAIFAAREKAGLDRVWPVKRIAVAVASPEAFDAIQSFRKIIVTQSRAKELDIVPPGETWRGLNLSVKLASDAIARAYRLWARKIEILLLSQDAWKIKSGLEKGEYHVGVEGQKVRIDPTMVSFTESVPDNVVEQLFEGGRVYVDTAMTDEILAEGYAKELVNIIRDVRRDLKLSGDIWIETRIRASETMNKLLRNWKDYISKETNTQALRFVRGDISDGYVVECSLGQESFTVSVKPVEGIVAEA